MQCFSKIGRRALLLPVCMLCGLAFNAPAYPEETAVGRDAPETAREEMNGMSIYDYSVETPDGEFIPLKNFAGKVVLIVNTATGCGFTPHYKPLQKMYERYHDKGLEIIDIPCNQFAGQTPGTDKEIHDFCTLRYHTTFPQMKKSDVNGETSLPLYRFLKEKQGFKGFGHGAAAFAMSIMAKRVDKNYKNNAAIKWNFTKFIVDRSGNVVARFEPTENMKKVEKFVADLLEQPVQ